MRTFVTRVIPIFLAAAISAAASPQIPMRPQPIIQNPNVPRPPAGNPKPGTGGPSHHEQYTALEFTVWTGDDDLRPQSVAYVDLKFPDGTTQRCVLHPSQDDGWSNNTTHQARQCILSSAKNWNQLRSATMLLVLDSSMEAFLEMGDNWNVNAVRVTAIDPADKHYPCLLNVRAKPMLVRLKPTLPSYDITQTENHC
jgi:hypothetical protein